MTGFAWKGRNAMSATICASTRQKERLPVCQNTVTSPQSSAVVLLAHRWRSFAVKRDPGLSGQRRAARQGFQRYAETSGGRPASDALVCGSMSMSVVMSCFRTHSIRSLRPFGEYGWRSAPPCLRCPCLVRGIRTGEINGPTAAVSKSSPRSRQCARSASTVSVLTETRALSVALANHGQLPNGLVGRIMWSSGDCVTMCVGDFFAAQA